MKIVLKVVALTIVLVSLGQSAQAACASPAGTAGQMQYISGVYKYCNNSDVWISITGTSTPVGADSEVQFNNLGAMGSSAYFTWNNTTGTLSAVGISGFGSAISGAAATGVKGTSTCGGGVCRGVWGDAGGGGPSIGVYGTGSQASHYAIYGEASGSATGGYFTSTSGNALVTGTGNVGIGTVSPQGRLHITSTSGNDAHLRIDATNADPKLTLTTLGGLDWSVGVDQSDGSKFKISANTLSPGFGDVLTITSTSNVGIGTTSPGVPLDVSNSNGIKLRLAGGGGMNGMSFGALSGGDEFYLYNDVNALRIFDNTTSADRMAILNNGNVGIGVTTPAYKLDVAGTINSSSVITATTSVNSAAFNYTSDRRFKENIVSINSPLEKVMRLRGVTFDWKKTGKSDIGFIAQEVEEVLPDIVSNQRSPQDGDYKTVKYGNIVAVVVEALKEMYSEFIERFSQAEQRVAALEEENARLKANQKSLEQRLQALEGKLSEQGASQRSPADSQ